MKASTRFHTIVNLAVVIFSTVLFEACTAPSDEGAAEAPEATGEPTTELVTGAAEEGAAEGGPSCDRAASWFFEEGGAGVSEADLSGLAAALPEDPRHANASTLDTLDRIAEAGPAAAALSDRLVAYVESPASDRIGAAAVRALAAADPERFVLIGPGALNHPERTLPVRFEVAAELARRGHVNILAPMFGTTTPAGTAVRRSMLVARRHPALLRDAMFGDAGPCRALSTDECVAMFRDLVIYDPALDAPDTPGLAALLRAESRVLSGDTEASEAWREAALAALETQPVHVATSARELGAYGAAETFAPLAWALTDLTTVPDLTRRALASHVLSAVGALGPAPEAEPSDPLSAAIRFVLASAQSGGARVPAGIDAIIDGEADPFSAALLLALAEAGQQDVVARAGRRFPPGTAELIGAVQRGEVTAVAEAALSAQLDETIAAHGLRVVGGASPMSLAREVEAISLGTPARRAALLARLGGSPEMAVRVGAQLDALPSVEASAWLASHGVDLSPFVSASLESEDARERRRAGLVALRAGVAAPAAALRSAIVVASPSQRIERRDARVIPLRALLEQSGDASLDDALTLADALSDRRAGRFEVAVVMQRALDAHCAE